MMLTEFLLARIAEDEAVANTAVEQFTPARVLAECEAKRRIVEDAAKAEWIEEQGHITDYSQGELGAYRSALRFLTLPYADHPDYREEWRP